MNVEHDTQESVEEIDPAKIRVGRPGFFSAPSPGLGYNFEVYGNFATTTNIGHGDAERDFNKYSPYVYTATAVDAIFNRLLEEIQTLKGEITTLKSNQTSS